MNTENRKDLEEVISCLQSNILTASTDLSDMNMTDPKYLNQARSIKELSDALGKVLTGYSNMEKAEAERSSKRKTKWYEAIEWTRIITCLLAGTMGIGQAMMLYSWQQNGYYIGKETSRLQMPRMI